MIPSRHRRLIPVLVALVLAAALCVRADTGTRGEARGDAASGSEHGSNVVSDCRSMLDFAHALEEDLEHYRAVTEYMRARFLCDGPVDTECDLGIARCLLRSGAFLDLAVWGEEVTEPDESGTGARLRFLAGVGRYELGSYVEAADDFRKAYMWGRGTPLAGPSALNWGVALARGGRFDRARASLDLAEDLHFGGEELRIVRECVDQAAAFRSRSKGVARALAVVPGLGYAYSGHWQTALVTAALVGLSAWGVSEAADDENWGTVTVLGFFGFTWYTGSIYGSGQASERYNEAELARILGPAEILRPDWVARPEDPALGP